LRYREISFDPKALSTDSLLLHGLLTGLLGLLLLLHPHRMGDLFRWCCFGLYLLSGVVGLLSFVFGRKTEVRRLRQLLMAMFWLWMAWFAYARPERQMAVVPLVLGVQAVLNGVLLFTTCYLQRKNNEWMEMHPFFMGMLSLMLGGLLVIWPVHLIDAGFALAGVYCLMASAIQLRDFVEESRPSVRIKRPFRRVRSTGTPGLMASLLRPMRAWKKVEKIWDTLVEREQQEPEDDTPDPDPDFEIFVHATEKGLGTVGHVDICFEGRVMTYGPYDVSSHKMLGLICNGVLAVVEGRERYLEFCTNYSHKTIFCYGLRLTGEQRLRVRRQIEELMQGVHPWASPWQRRPDKKHSDYASVLQRELGAALYQFHEGEFQTYFMGGTNCAVLADRIIGSLGTDVLTLSGIVTPGAYYSYLEREYRKKNGIVVSKHVAKAVG